MSRSVRKVVGLVVALAFSAVVMVGCGGNDNPGGNGPGIDVPDVKDPTTDGSWDVTGPDGFVRDSRLVGSWRVSENGYDGGPSEASIITFDASGSYRNLWFEKIGDFWMEEYGEFDGLWRTEKGEVYFFSDNNNEWDSGGSYTVSSNGNTITVIDEWYDDEINYTFIVTITLTKINLTNFRNSLGTIHTKNEQLYGRWQLSESTNDILTFSYRAWSNDLRRYFGSEDVDEVVWYTSDTRLFLVAVGCTRFETRNDGDESWEYCASYIVTETVELDYTLTTSGDTRTLRLRPVNPNGTLGSADVWESVSDNYYYSMSKSTQNRHLINPEGGGNKYRRSWMSGRL